MNDYWDIVINNVLPFIYKDGINIKQLKDTLELSQDYKIKHLDQLYLRGLIDRNEYMHYIDRLIDKLGSTIAFLRKIRKEAEEAGPDFNPLTHFCSCPRKCD